MKKVWGAVKDFFVKYESSKVLGFAFANGIIWMLMSIAYLHFISISESTVWERLYSVIFAVGHLGVFSFGLWIILQLLRLIGEKTFKVSAIILGCLLFFLLFADIVVYAQYRFHINIPMLGLFISPAAFELVSFPIGMILCLILIIIGAAAAEWGLFYLAGKFRFPRIYLAWLLVIVLSFLSFNAVHAWCAFHGYRNYLIRTDALPLKYVMTATRFLMRRGYTPAQKIKTTVLGKIMKYPVNKLMFKEPAKKKNVILILIDSLRADMFNAEVMPRLYQRSVKTPGVKFEQHFSGGNCTKTGVFNLFYGIPGFYFDQAQRSGTGAAMIDSFLANKYDIKTFPSGTLAAPPFNRTVFVNVPNIKLSTPGSSKIDRDLNCFKDFTEYLKNRDKKQPYFAFLFLDSLHGNAIPKGFKRKFGSTMHKINYLEITNDAETREKLLTFTKDAVYFIDSMLDDFLSSPVVREAIAEDTVVIITADHGNEYGESQMWNWGHNSNFARYQTQVPLIIFGLDRPAGTVEYRTSASDVSVTVMQDVLGCTNDVSDYSSGKNLFDASERPYIISSSYLETALIYRDKVFAMTVYGVMQKYSLDGKIIDDPLPADGMKYLLSMMSKYSK